MILRVISKQGRESTNVEVVENGVRSVVVVLGVVLQTSSTGDLTSLHHVSLSSTTVALKRQLQLVKQHRCTHVAIVMHFMFALNVCVSTDTN